MHSRHASHVVTFVNLCTKQSHSGRLLHLVRVKRIRGETYQRVLDTQLNLLPTAYVANGAVTDHCKVSVTKVTSVAR